MEFTRGEEHQRAREAAVLAEYAVLLKPHIDSSGGRMILLDSDPSRYQAQALDCHVVEGDPQSAGIVEVIAAQAESRFPQIMEAIHSPENAQLLGNTGEILKRGDNIMLVTNHSSLIDVPLVSAGVYSALNELGYSFNTGIIISKIISRLGYVLDKDAPAVPAVDALKLIADDVMESFPRTPTMQKSKIFDFVASHIDIHNRKLRSTVSRRQDADEGYLLSVAGSGATDKPVPGRPDTLRLGELSNGTIKMMMDRHTFVIPVAIWMKGENIVMDFCSLRAVTTPAEGHQVMADISDRLNQIVDDKNFDYSPTSRQVGSAALKKSR